ncbi:MAG: hypothetical protein NC122_00030 [Faecalibacterium sp.]|nr:hypothetical protein [Ruminococcus sp.]MCM1391367.1 hypothetical protein [Ruminococcus sp.]MCM1484577.1 hypothetical protein [Faecalibacterium sp.]
MKKTKKKPLEKRLKKYERIVHAVGMIAVAAFSIYQLVPKDDKFDGVDGVKLAENRTVEAELG